MPLTGLLNKDTLNQAPTTRTVSDNELSSVQMGKITGKDSVMRQRAEASGKNYSAGRGLLNTSIGAEAAFGALVDRATPLALADADRYGKVADQNMAAENQFKMSDKNFVQGGLLQKDQQQFQTGESALDRNLQKDMQTTDQTFRSGENAMDRTLQTDLQSKEFTFQGGENALDRTFQTGERQGAQEFSAGQNTLDRNLQTNLQQSDQTFRAGENAADRDLTKSESALGREQELQIVQSEQAWRSGENTADRTLQQNMQANDQNWQGGQNAADRILTMSESEKNRLLEQALQSQDQDWRGGQNAADRLLTMSEADKNRELEKYLQTQDQANQSTLLDKQQGFARDESALDRALGREEIESRELMAMEQSRAELDRLGYSLELDKSQLNAATQNQIQMTLLSQIMAIQGDANLDPSSKETAIANAQDAAKSMATAIGAAAQTEFVMPAMRNMPFNTERASNILVDEARKMGHLNPTMPELDMALQHARAQGLSEQQMRAYVRSMLPPVAETPRPVTPAPVTPAPVTPPPSNQAPVTPAPVTPAPVTPPANSIAPDLPPPGGYSDAQISMILVDEAAKNGFNNPSAQDMAYAQKYVKDNNLNQAQAREFVKGELEKSRNPQQGLLQPPAPVTPPAATPVTPPPAATPATPPAAVTPPASVTTPSPVPPTGSAGPSGSESAPVTPPPANTPPPAIDYGSQMTSLASQGGYTLTPGQLQAATDLATRNNWTPEFVNAFMPNYIKILRGN